MIFKNREEAGEKLAEKLILYKNESPIVLALPRGGVVVGYVVAESLKAPLNVIVVKKLSAPGNPEFGIGAVAQNGITILNNNSINNLHLTIKDIKEIKEKETKELERRIKEYNSFDSLKQIRGRIVILVDDGLATGVTAKAAIRAVKKESPRKIILANPVCAFETARMLKPEVNEIICVTSPVDFSSVGAFYKDFEQVTDEEVISLLNKAKKLYKEDFRNNLFFQGKR